MKAIFQRSQRVWVEAVGAWSMIEKINPVWAKGFDEPIRITYDVGLGREFLAHELLAEDAPAVEANEERWRLLRARNKWQSLAECSLHPYPGTYPVVVTDPNDWGGWRVPGAEYDRDPQRIEAQARLIASAPGLRAVIADLVALVAEAATDVPEELAELALRAAKLEDFIRDKHAAPSSGVSATQAA